MMIPLTPDVCARVVLCDKDARSMMPPYANAINPLRGPLQASSAPGQGSPAIGSSRCPQTASSLRRSKSSVALSSHKARTSHEQRNRTTEALPPRLHRSQSMVDVTRRGTEQLFALQDTEREQEAAAAEKAASPSRISYMRHIIGFRKYNKLPEMRKRIIDACNVIEFMAKNHHGAYQLALEQVDESLAHLCIAEQNFYKETDRVKHYEEKVDELNYLKANIELCIKESIAFVREKYYTDYVPTVINATKNTRCQWRDHKEIRIYVDQLQANLQSSQEEDEERGTAPTLSFIQQIIYEARARCARRHEWHHLRPLFEAEDELGELQEHLDKIQRSEVMLKASLLRYQASTNTLINVNREINATTKILKARAELASRISDTETRDLDEEERLLREFILAGRHYNASPGFSTPSSPSSDDFLPPMRSTTPLTPSTSPVWLTKWSPNTKVLARH